MWGLNTLETWLAAALCIVVLGGGTALSYMTERHQCIRDQRRRARIAARAKLRRERGISVRPQR